YSLCFLSRALLLLPAHCFLLRYQKNRAQSLQVANGFLDPQSRAKSRSCNRPIAFLLLRQLVAAEQGSAVMPPFPSIIRVRQETRALAPASIRRVGQGPLVPLRSAVTGPSAPHAEGSAQLLPGQVSQLLFRLTANSGRVPAQIDPEVLPSSSCADPPLVSQPRRALHVQADGLPLSPVHDRLRMRVVTLRQSFLASMRMPV